MSAAITHAAWLKAPETRALISALEQDRPGGSRFVGGCVRNTVMMREIDDIDIATQLTPDRVTDLVTRAGFAAHPTGVEHGTITVVVNHQPFEVTTLRRDVTTDGRRATVAFTEDWSEDAHRRDFRLNALYASPDGEVFDPTGGGLEDARVGRVIFIGDAHTRIREDYLRILRFFRFNAWYARGPIDPHGLTACADLVAGLDILAEERVWKEVKKLLAAPDARAAWEGMEAVEVRARAHLNCLHAFPCSASVRRGQELLDLLPHALFREDVEARDKIGARGQAVRIDRAARVPRIEAEKTEDPQVIFANTCVRVANEDHAPDTRVLQSAASRIEYLSVG